MNLFAVNAAEVNGSIEVWSWYGDAALAVDAAGELKLGLVLAGDAQVVTTGALEPQMRAIPNLVASDIQVAAAGEAIYGRTGEGTAQIVASAVGEGRRWTFGESNAAQIVFELEGDAQVLQPAAGNFTLVVNSALDADVRSTVIEPGFAAIVLDGSLESKVSRRHLGEGVAEIHLASVGSGYLVVDGPASLAQVVLLAEGDARSGGQVFAEGSAVIELFARGSVDSIHYEFGEGEAIVAIMALATPGAVPTIPAEYVQAPRIRTFMVSKEDRDMRIDRDRRVF